ncbi:AlpA family transcriptional regulator [Protaetiibacter sp. SSC-01]|uniref:helix-turn-helix transcriptional regulator n=1 Tax=Protaetiibacter sp. SSC-01 TaxID=2759943 RepID=UPI00223A7B18|nr:helix-turn-helix domain-containing protein [Protaetiibacter sp. SSC-01]
MTNNPATISHLPFGDTEPLMTVEDLSAYLVIPVATLYKWRTLGEGPRGIRIGRHIRYHRSEVQAWLAARAEAVA